MFGKKKGTSGLDIGNDSAKGIELSKRFGKITVQKFAFGLNRNNSFKNGEITDAAQLSSSLKALLKGFPTNVVFPMCGSSMMVKKIKIPKMDEEFIPEQIRWEAEQYIPFNIDEVNIDYVVLKSFEKSEFMYLLLVAIQKDKISAYQDLLGKSGLMATAADVTGFALANCFNFNYPEDGEQVVALIDIGAFYTNFVIIDRKQVEYYRDINFGGIKYDEELSKNLGVSLDEARKLKESALSSGSELPDIAVDTLMSVSKKLAEQILGSFEFFKNTDGFEKDIDKVYITGGGSLAMGVTDQLETVMGKPVSYLDVFKKLTVSPKVLKSSSEVNLQYKSAVALGLAIREY